MIKPTVGRVVWVIRPDHTADVSQPEAALITYVWNDRLINVAGFNKHGAHFQHQGMQLLQDDDLKPEGAFAVWMPYQKGQAAKAEAEAAVRLGGVEPWGKQEPPIGSAATQEKPVEEGQTEMVSHPTPTPTPVDPTPQPPKE